MNQLSPANRGPSGQTIVTTVPTPIGYGASGASRRLVITNNSGASIFGAYDPLVSATTGIEIMAPTVTFFYVQGQFYACTASGSATVSWLHELNL